MKKKYTKDYSIIDNAVLQCNELSIEARGAYAYCFSLPDDWEFSIFRVAKSFNCGVDKATRIINELIEFGLLEKEIYHNEKGHKKVSYILYDMGTRIEKTNKENPYKENPYKENPDNNKIIIDTNNENHKELNLNTPSLFPQSEIQVEAKEESPLKSKKRKIEYAAEFESFYSAYPRQINKAVAFTTWNRVIKTQSVEVLIAKAKEYAEYCVANQTLETYIAHPSTWLNRNYFENDYKSMMPQGYKQRQAVMQRGLSDWGSNDDDNEVF